jgi:hypothetical protein
MASDGEFAPANLSDDSGEYFEESEDDDDLTRMQTSLILAIRNGDVHLDRDTDEEISKFKETYSSCFIGGEYGTVIHMALQECRDSDFDVFKLFFRWSIGSYPSLLEERNREGETILHFAIQKRLSIVTEYLCICAPDEATRSKAISCRGQHMRNCVHSAIRLKLDVSKYLVDVCNDSALTDQDNFGNTPLHLAVDCARGEIEYNMDMVTRLIQRCPGAAYTLNKDGLSPYGCHIATGKESQSVIEGSYSTRGRRLKSILSKGRKSRSSQLHSEWIKDLFKLLYLRNCSREECLTLIYGQSKTEGKFTPQDCRVQFKQLSEFFSNGQVNSQGGGL